MKSIIASKLEATYVLILIEAIILIIVLSNQAVYYSDMRV